jgi:hypothetical protein
LFYTLIGDALLLASLSWFAGYGGSGPLTGIRLTAKAKLRLFVEVFAITITLLYLLITMDQLLGWATQPPWSGSPAPHRLVAMGVLLIVGFVHARRRARAWHQDLREATQPADPQLESAAESTTDEQDTSR